jgi:hypothetical protein
MADVPPNTAGPTGSSAPLRAIPSQIVNEAEVAYLKGVRLAAAQYG